MPTDDRPPFRAVVLAGGTSARLGGVDKAGAEHAGRTLLDHALEACADAAEVVVVGQEVPTARPVTFVVEDPPFGGPVAGLLAGVDALLPDARGSGGPIAVLAVDMPRVTAATLQRLHEAAVGRDGAFLHDGRGRRQLAGVLDAGRLAAVAPGPEGRHGMSVHRLLADLDLAAVAARGDEAADVDTWEDLRALREPDRRT